MTTLTLVKSPKPKHACVDCGTTGADLRITWDVGPAVLRCKPCLDAWWTQPKPA